ncbi:ras-associated and pleckstrin homology domains-containing protein 1-like isoform X2 [Physella acuta]|uniref:ras-associated and pleckstrin homology domains-containing protein 1-like isoform X2 n=1 Tax=Physella acuta TaxID=109671 RepID=UPI0027DD9FD2|nr:ras-associated and pleckstrin homology domains-containing protein 1-like isoform X2 [Physella acuta]
MEYFIHIKKPCQCSDLDPHETGTVRRRTKTIVTPKMAMESFRLSFLNDDQDVNFDAILGELYELESQLSSTQSELSRSLGGSHPPPPAAFQDGSDGSEHNGSSETIHVSEQEELDLLAAEITRGLHYHKANGHYHHHHHHHQHQQHHQQTVGGEGMCDNAETDSAFSDNASLPSSESFTSMVTVSSSADTTSSSSGETCSMNNAHCGVNHAEEEQIARLKAEKIRIALEKIREAKIRKLFVRAFAKDGSSKSILVDEKMSVSQVCSQLADKNHVRLNHKLSVVEHMPELLMERILEDHDSLVENMVMWTKDSKNKVMFEERMDKYDLFRNPEKYLLSSTAANKQGPLAPAQKDKLIQEFFSPESVCVPTMEGALYLKSDGKKAWKKFFFVLRASGLYYNPKGKPSKNPKDLVCLVQFEYVEVYRGIGWKKKYHAPTDFCFALKHPQIQKKTSKYIRYFCAETEMALDQWVMGVRIVKIGKQMLHNYERLTHEISMWDLRQPEPGVVAADEAICQMLNHADLSDSRMSVPEPGTRHSVIQVHNASHIRNSTSGVSDNPRDMISIEVLAIPPRKSSEGIDGRSLSGSVGSSSIGSSVSESSHKTPVKRVSFSATHSIINGDSVEQVVKHRDSIISASTDSSEDSNSSGEIRPGASFRGKMRPRLPVTTETTRQLADMCNVSMDENAEAIYAETHYRGGSSAFARTDRRRASMQERRGSCGSAGSDNSQRSSHVTRHSSMASSIKQHSLDSGAEQHTSPVVKQSSPVPVDSPYQHVRRKSEPSVAAVIGTVVEESPHSTYSPVYSPLREEKGELESLEQTHMYTIDQAHAEPVYNQIKSPASVRQTKVSNPAIPPPAQFREGESNHIPSFIHSNHEVTPSPHVQPMQVPPPPPPGPPAPIANNQKFLESPYGTCPSQPPSQPTGQPPSQPHLKSSPPATLPKPQSSQSLNGSTLPSGLPKQAPPPPARLSSNESTSSCSGLDSVTSSPIHVPIPPPMPPLTPKLPPPTLPKSSHAATTGASLIGNNAKPPTSPGVFHTEGLSSKTNGQPDGAKVKGRHNSTSSDEITGCPPQSPSLPFLSELSKRNNQDLNGGDTVELRNGQPTSLAQQHRRSASAGGVVGRNDKKCAPPPPPKRSENTRLSMDLILQQHSDNNGTSVPLHDPIYENFDGIMDIDELPPPPPELLMDLPFAESESQRTCGKKPKPPPPPPKRSKDTQLSSH